ncbi:sodium- and chloride-dependent transporter XTRP3-like [Styela clava]
MGDANTSAYETTTCNGGVKSSRSDSLEKIDPFAVEQEGLLTEEDKSDSSSDSSDSDGQMKERPAWDNKFQYIMAALGFAVGLGNIWRFPYLCQKNGGGAFLIPYFVMLFLEGYPLYFLELAVGQSMRKGAVGVWSHIHPQLVGVGFASIVVSLLIGLYYNMILAWTLFYLFNSFRSELPWAKCPENNGTIVHECAVSSSTAYFWYRDTLDISGSIEEGGVANWKMVVSLFIAWVLVFFGIIKGIKSSGKVMYFATIFPYVILIAFFVRGMTLEGAAAGVVHMFKPDLTRLVDPVVWREAATQIFFSLGLGYGAIIAYSSYNPYNNNCKKDALFVASANSLTSVFACITVFSVLGFKANLATKECMEVNRQTVLTAFPESYFIKNSSYVEFLQHMDELNSTYPDIFQNLSISNKNCSIEEELKEIGQGTGLAFIAFAETILSFPGAPVWAVLFFFMLLCIGMSSEFGILQAFITMVLDFGYKVSKLKLTSALCLSMFIIGLIFTMRSGSYFLDIFDGYSATFGLVSVALFETIAVAWVFKLENFENDIERMIHSKPGLYWRISWKYTCPFIMVVILIASFVDMFLNPPSYYAWNKDTGTKDELTYPPWAVFIIVLLILSSMLCIPLFAALVRFGIFDPKWIGVNSYGRNKRAEQNDNDDIGVTESATPLNLNSTNKV